MIPIRIKTLFHSPHHHPHSICHAIHNKGVGQKKRERGVTESKNPNTETTWKESCGGLKYQRNGQNLCDNDCLTFRLNFSKAEKRVV